MNDSQDITWTDRYSCCSVATAREQYCAAHSSQPSAGLDHIAKETKQHLDMGFMLSGGLNAQFLKMLAMMVGARRILEIGTYTGYTAVALAEALPPGGALICIDDFSDEAQSERIARNALAKCANAALVQLIKNNGRDALTELAREKAEPFDFVFIDADKESQIFYYDTLLDSGLLAPNGVICVDNTLWYSKVVHGETDETTRAIHEFNEHVARDTRTHKVMVPIRDGITIIRRIDGTSKTFFYSVPYHYETLPEVLKT